jgi:hypothetical protein
MRVYLLLCSILLVAACSKREDSTDDINAEPLIGSWQEIEKGVKYGDGRIESTSDACDNQRVIKFFEDGKLEYTDAYSEGGNCVFYDPRDGELRKETTPTWAEANYFGIFYSIPEDDEESGYISISVNNDILTWKFGYNNDPEYAEYSYRKYKKI